MKALDNFLRYLSNKNYSLKTITAYNKDLSDFIAYLDLDKSHSQCDEHQIASIHIDELRNYIQHLYEQGLTARSINRKLSSIKSFFKYLCKVHPESANPALLIKTLKTSKKRQIPLSFQEITQATENAWDLEVALMIELFYQCGLRREELRNLKIDQIDFLKNLITIKGKGGKWRQIPISDQLSFKIKQHLTEKKIGSEYVFSNSKGMNYAPSTIYLKIIKAISPYSNKLKNSPHIIRHSFASHLLQNGADLNSVKELLGHASLNTTQIYLDTNIQQIRKIYNRTHPRGNNNNIE